MANIKITSLPNFESSIYKNLIIPTKIGSNDVTEISLNQYHNKNYKGFLLAPTITSIEEESFREFKISKANFPKLQSIPSYCFTSNSNLTFFSAPSCTIIGDWAFGECELSSFYFPSVSYIGRSAFYENKFEEINFPNCTHIGKNAFERCYNLKNINLSNCSRVDDWAFSVCSNINISKVNLTGCKYFGKNVFVSDTISKMSSENGFYYLPCFSGVALLSNTNSSFVEPVIGEYNTAILNCGDLHYSELGSSFSILDSSNLYQVGDSSFSYCSYLSTINLQNCLNIGEQAFRNCHLLSSINIQNCLNISQYAFNDCGISNSISLPNCVTIGSHRAYSYFNGRTFYGNTVSSFYLPECTSIYGSMNFTSNTTYINLPKLIYTEDDFKITPFYDNQISSSGIAFLNASLVSKKWLLGTSSETSVISDSEVTDVIQLACYNDSSLTTVDLQNCDIVWSSAFQSCASLSSVNLPKCSAIKGYAFSGCTSLSSVNIPECINLGTWAFGECTSLSNISLPNCKSLGYLALGYCNFSTLSLPKCNFIGESAFYSNSSLYTLYLMSNKVCYLDTDGLDGTPFIDGEGSIYVPGSLVSIYQTADRWRYYSSRIFAGD